MEESERVGASNQLQNIFRSIVVNHPNMTPNNIYFVVKVIETTYNLWQRCTIEPAIEGCVWRQKKRKFNIKNNTNLYSFFVTWCKANGLVINMIY